MKRSYLQFKFSKKLKLHGNKRFKIRHLIELKLYREKEFFLANTSNETTGKMHQIFSIEELKARRNI